MLHFSRFKTICMWGTVFIGLLFAAPNFIPSSALHLLPSFLPKQSLVPGLDLQGGVHVLLALDKKGLIHERLETARDEVRYLLRSAKIEHASLTTSKRSVQVRIMRAEKISAAKKALSDLSSPTGGFFSAANHSVSEFSEEELPNGFLRYTLSDSAIDHHVTAAVSRSISVLGQRINELGTTEPVIQRQGRERILVQIPGLQDTVRLKAILGQTARLTFQMVHSSAEKNPRKPPGTVIMHSRETPSFPYFIESRIALAGENVVDAQPGFDPVTREPVVIFRLDTKGALLFSQISRQNVGRSFAIILDGKVVSAPMIREPISGGSGQISGNFTLEEANDLALLLRSGALPADLTIVEERTVGASLGADSIASGKKASVIACVLVAVFMFAAYSTLGFIANIALALNLMLIISVLSALGATLTMPGIAGIVLTIGMAVDSNVIIYERIREEHALGKPLVHAFDTGFSRAMATLLDANFTTLLAAIVLFFLGSGPVRGFAITLAIGIITTVFSTFTLTRWMSAFWLWRMKPRSFPAGFLAFFSRHVPQIAFMRWRRYAFFFLVLVCFLVPALFFSFQMNYGIDFKGGTSVEVRAKDSSLADSGLIRNRLAGLNIGDIQVQQVGSEGDFLIQGEGQSVDAGVEKSVVDKIRFALGKDYEIRRIEAVGPAISSELAFHGVIALLVSLFAIFAYIWFRFEWQFSIGAIIATIHDVILIIGIYIISGIEFNLTSIAAILTIVGYSINDTVVIYDRVRENLRKYKKMPIEELIDMSINQTLLRTVLTGVTSLLSLGSLYFFGGEVIRSFTFAMIFGILIGTYSSIFVAGPLLVFFRLKSGSLTHHDSDQSLLREERLSVHNSSS